MLSPSRRRGDVLAGLVLAALGTYIAGQSLAWQVLGPSGPGPGFFPLIYGALMVVLSLALVVKATMRRPARAAATPAPLEEPAREPALDSDPRAAIAIWLLFVATIAAIKYVGFLIAFGLLLLLTSRLVFSRPLWQGAVAAIVAPPLFYLVFVLGLQVRLPVGTLTGI